ncbi:uncharacterized protein CELE_F26D2.2 [Caenorhabditis elegans]|uniref:Synaptonemal complex protein SYP-1 n=1 Tax=Caenorhabditis elegans TaxID=6239 RepID=G5EGS8_CAEEL|nr:Uncharacterized protein CELE_F26D2.2 [Caenorhabditis elegans]AAM55225.1 synaptonemal complex protein SYP-1 [Caenorhabditis elegans]CAB04186.2 Uncharacterized protein CELE_F26D2.2 [Caenorhabditis elegans]|eukprot:NP_507145.2 Uncharacterized protein CELE_F26D2.2 [Caenorhabditis elegans]
MDNFTIWVDAPTEALIETPVDDQSSGFLRDEIMLTQQYVLEKLDEQTEQDKGEQTDEQAAKSRELASQVQTESQRMHDIKKELNVFKESCKSIELQLVSVKKSIPDRTKLQSGEKEKSLNEADYELSKFEDLLSSRERELTKIIQREQSRNNGEAKNECKRLREMIMAAKQKHEKLVELNSSCAMMQAKYDEMIIRQDQDREALEEGKLNLKASEEKLEQMREDCVTLRSQLFQFEASRSQDKTTEIEKEIEKITAETAKVRVENEQLKASLSKIKEDTKILKLKYEARQQEDIENKKLIEERKRSIIELLRRKIAEKKKSNTVKGSDRKKITSLKKAIAKEQEKLEKGKKELEQLQSSKTESDLEEEISAMQLEINDYDKQIKDAAKEHEKLFNQIKEQRAANGDQFNDTIDIVESDYSDRVVPPQPSVEVTPVHRQVSHDVFSAPLMTSTPLTAATRPLKRTRAADRLKTRAEAHTADVRRKRGGKK